MEKILEQKKLEFNILHFSDLHFGKNSLLSDSKGIEVFDDFFLKTKELFTNIINDMKIKAVVLTGDISSRGEKKHYGDRYMDDLLRIFSDKKIPIIICNGNHDLDRDLINKKKQFSFFFEFISTKIDLLNIDLFEKFNENQAMYLFLKEFNTLFIALNSCKYIEEKLIDEKIKEKIQDKNELNIYLNQENLNFGRIKRSDVENCFNELENTFGKKRLKYMNKILICHHGLEFLQKSKDSIDFIVEKGFKLILSGHIHEYKKQFYNKKIMGLVSGSFLSNKDSRSDSINLDVHKLQFNTYKIDVTNGKIIPNVYSFEYTKGWNYEEKQDESIDMYIVYEDLKKWEVDIKCKVDNSIFENTKYIVKTQKNNYQYICYDNNEEETYVWIINEHDTQIFVDSIKDWIINNFDKIIDGTVNILILNRTNSYKMQLPKQYLINC